MKLKESVKSSIKKLFEAFGFELRRVSDKELPAPLYEDTLLVIEKTNSHENAALKCPIGRCVSFNGLSFSPNGWHPFVQAASEYLEDGEKNYSSSSLKQYYQLWQPENAREALLLSENSGPALLNKYPSFTKHTPWSHRSIEQRVSYMKKVIEIENSEYGNANLSPSEGYGLHGPVSEKKGTIEYFRILELVESIKNSGYDRSKGDITVEALKRGKEYKFVIVHGHHRAAAMSALGCEYIPAVPLMIVDREEVDHWPSVYKGIWTRKEALEYFNHLFDFDSLCWAKELGLEV